MVIKGYYLESLYPRFSIYRIIVINYLYELSTYNVAINVGDDIKERYPDYIDLGGILK